MGWCSATQIFDDVCDALLGEGENKLTKKAALTAIISALEDGDWDCQQDSRYWDHPLVQKIMRKLHPEWFDDEDEE